MKAKKQAAAAPTRISRPPRNTSASTRSRPRRSSSTMSVRRVARAVDDGYEHELVPGLRASEDALRLAHDLAFASARLDELQNRPAGLYAEVSATADPREAAWLAFLIAVLSPLEGDDPWAAIEPARTTLASGELPDVAEAERGPRAAPDPVAALPAFRTWLERPDPLAAELSLPPARRFDRLYERLSLAGLARTQRYEFLVLVGRLGVAELEAPGLRLGEARDDTTTAAKRIFAIGDSVLLSSRAAELAEAAGVPLAALDLALVRWTRNEPITAGATVDGADRVGPIADMLGVGVADESADEGADDLDDGADESDAASGDAERQPGIVVDFGD
jgi:hypothetical protein